MKSEAFKNVRLDGLVDALACENVWQYEYCSDKTCHDVAGQTHEALQSPLDFPSIESAIVAGDRVALAVDPNVPQIGEVLTGVLKTLALTEAGDVDIVVWDEASETTMDAIREAAGDTASVFKHESILRESLRYLAADKDATPIYLNRMLVDADFVLPIVSSRTMDAVGGHDLTGVFPSLADSATRKRHRLRMIDAAAANDDGEEAQIPWLLGVHMILAVNVNSSGKIGEVVAGMPDAIRKQRMSGHSNTGGNVAGSFPEQASLVVASLDGDAQQQTWTNAARALAAASRNVAPGGSIVLWTAIYEPPSGILAHLEDIDDPQSILTNEEERFSEGESDNGEGDFPRWDSHLSVASTFARVLADHRVLMHSELPNESIEPMGVGVIEDQKQLVHLSQSFESCGILRVAQFADGTVDSPLRSDEPSVPFQPSEE